jgi:ABC-2 type transport system ATP-binding protein
VGTKPVIEVRDLTKLYGETVGVDGVDLVVERGEVFGFLGPNGAGKTTTIRLLLDLIRPTRGRALVGDLDARRDGLEVRRRSGYLPGELNLPPKHTGRRWLSYIAKLRQMPDIREADRLAERLGLDLERQIDELSKGNKEKIGVVAAFMHDPNLLILDEPTSGLDPLRQRDVREMIRERAEAGRTVFLSSHELDQVEQVAGRVGIIRDGRLIAVEEIAALQRRAVRRVEIRLASGSAIEGLDRIEGVHDVEARDGVVRLRVEGRMDALIKELARHPVETLTSETPDLDEVFLGYYGDPDAS